MHFLNTISDMSECFPEILIVCSELICKLIEAADLEISIFYCRSDFVYAVQYDNKCLMSYCIKLKY